MNKLLIHGWENKKYYLINDENSLFEIFYEIIKSNYNNGAYKEDLKFLKYVDYYDYIKREKNIYFFKDITDKSDSMYVYYGENSNAYRNYFRRTACARLIMEVINSSLSNDILEKSKRLIEFRYKVWGFRAEDYPFIDRNPYQDDWFKIVDFELVQC